MKDFFYLLIANIIIYFIFIDRNSVVKADLYTPEESANVTQMQILD